MVQLAWAQRCRSAIEGSQLSCEQRLACIKIVPQFDGLEYALTPSIVDGDFQLEIHINASNKATTLLNTTQWVRDKFTEAGVTELSVASNEDEGFSTIVVRAIQSGADEEAKETQDETVAPNEVPTPAPNPTTDISTKTEETKTTEKSPIADGLSDEAQATVGTDSKNTSEFYLNVEVYLEGVQIPHSSCTISYGLASPPSCTIIMPATSIIRDLPSWTKVHVFFKDLLPDSNGNYEWRLLFDGELAGFSYSVDAQGAAMSITAIHSTTFLTLMQLMTLDAAEYLFNPNPRMIGDATMPMIFGQSKINSKLVGNIIKGKNFDSMADIVYQLLRAILVGTKDSAVAKYYNSKLGNDPGAWKILKRMYGVSQKAVDSPVATYDTQYDNSGKLKGGTSTGSANGAGSTGASGSSVAPGEDNKIANAAFSYLYSTGRDTTVDGIGTFECDGLVTAAIRKAGVEPSGWPEHYVPTQREYFESKGWYSTNYNNVVTGDVITLHCSEESDHTGIFMRGADGKGYLIHNSSSQSETIQTAWEPPGVEGFAYEGHGRIPM